MRFVSGHAVLRRGMKTIAFVGVVALVACSPEEKPEARGETAEEFYARIGPANKAEAEAKVDAMMRDAARKAAAYRGEPEWYTPDPAPVVVVPVPVAPPAQREDLDEINRRLMEIEERQQMHEMERFMEESTR
jgi:hypothetical protein